MGILKSVLWAAYPLFVLLSLKYAILTTVHCGCSGIFKISVVLENRESSLNFLKTCTLVIETWSPRNHCFLLHSVWKNHTEVIFHANDTRCSSSADLLICCTFWNTMLGCCFILIEYLPNLCLYPLTSKSQHEEIWFQMLRHRNKMLSNYSTSPGLLNVVRTFSFSSSFVPCICCSHAHIVFTL